MSHRAGRVVVVSGAVLVAALLAGVTLARAADLTPRERELAGEARKEGAVTVLNPIFGDHTGQNLAAAFIKRYDLGDGFKFNNLRKGTGATIAQVTQEIKAGRFTVDVHIVSDPGFFDAAHKQGAFLALDSSYWKDHVELVEKAGQYHQYPYVVVPFAYTFQPVWNTSCPGMADIAVTSLADTVQPALRGKTISPDITKSSTYTNTTLALMEAGVDMNAFWDRLKATEPIIEFRTEPKMQMVMTCERPFDMWNLSSRVVHNVLKKPELAQVLRIGSFAEGQVMLGNQAAVLKGAPHPSAGQLFLEFLLSKEGTDVLVESEILYSFRKDYVPPAAAQPYLLDLSKHKLLGLKDWVESRAKFPEVRKEWEARFK